LLLSLLISIPPKSQQGSDGLKNYDEISLQKGGLKQTFFWSNFFCLSLFFFDSLTFFFIPSKLKKGGTPSKQQQNDQKSREKTTKVNRMKNHIASLISLKS
jgi:hypothetical protein